MLVKEGAGACGFAWRWEEESREYKLSQLYLEARI